MAAPGNRQRWMDLTPAALQAGARALRPVVRVGGEIWGRKLALSGARTVLSNIQGPGGTISGGVVGAGRIMTGVGMMGGGHPVVMGMGVVTQLGAQAIRDAHDMNPDQITQTLQNHVGAFNAAQLATVSETRRLFRFAKAANPHLGMGAQSDDAMRGGHVVVHDNGALDARLRIREAGGLHGGGRRGQNQRFPNLPSSHYPNVPNQQSEHQLPSNDNINFGTVLHGSIGPVGANSSWFQVEAHSGVRSGAGGYGRFLMDAALHGSDFARHRYGMMQIGPLGTSTVSENNPQGPLIVTREHIQRSRLATAAANAGRLRAIAQFGAAGAAAAGINMTPVTRLR